MDITPLMLEFRAACRQLWNEHYLQSIEVSGGSFELEENFCKLEMMLFRAIVLTASHKFPDLKGRRVLMRVDDTLVHYAVTGVE